MRRRYAKSMRELARALGVSHPVILRILRRRPNPGTDRNGYDIEEWARCVHVYYAPWKATRRL
jgi:hypothetical protein